MQWGPRFIFENEADIQLDEVENNLSKILYVRARNGMVHDGELDRFEIIESGIGLAGKVQLGRGFILALCLAVIGDPVNRNEKFERPQGVTIGGVS